MNPYIFNYNSNPLLPKCGEESIENDKYINVSQSQDSVYNIYYINEQLQTNKEIVFISENVIILLISTTNSAHSISEIISFISYYKSNNYSNTVLVSEYFIKSLPLLFEFLKLFIPEERFIIIYEKYEYKIQTLITFRCVHYIHSTSWNMVDFIYLNNNLYFENIQYIKNEHYKPADEETFNKVKQIYDNHKNEYQLYDNIMLIKFNNEICTTPNRGIKPLSIEIENMFKSKEIKIISIQHFQNINHYLCQLYHAKNIVFSYGGPCCTNRFFCNPNANIIVIANKHYEAEYDYDNANKMYWHVRSACLIPVKRQIFLLEFENEINNENIDRIFSNLCYDSNSV